MKNNHRCKGSLEAKVSIHNKNGSKGIDNPWRLFTYEYDDDFKDYMVYCVGEIKYCPYCGANLESAIQIKEISSVLGNFEIEYNSSENTKIYLKDRDIDIKKAFEYIEENMMKNGAEIEVYVIDLFRGYRRVCRDKK